MALITLEEQLRIKGSLNSGLIAKSNLIDKLEVYGFVNACKDKDMYEKLYTGYILNGIVNKEPKRQIVLSEHIYQVTTNYSGEEITREGHVTPIYQRLQICHEMKKYNVEDLRVPSLIGNKLYRKIKSRHGQGVIVTAREIEKAKFPSYITEEEGKAILSAPEGHVRCLDNDGLIKSIGENVMVVCRYLHPETGTLCYTQYNLNEVYVDDVH